VSEKKTKYIRQTLKACICIAVMAGRFDWNFGMKYVPPWGTFHSKNGAILFRHYWGKLQMRENSIFLFLYNAHLSVACLHWPYLATQHTITGAVETIFDRSSHIQGGVWAQPDLSWLLMWSYSTHSVWILRGVGCMPPPHPRKFRKITPFEIESEDIFNNVHVSRHR